MDYKEKYEQALRFATIYHKQGNENMKIMMETCFPELAESEDEKIRKWIVDDITFNMNNEPLNNSEYRKKAEKAIAWLEKQKEYESTDFEYVWDRTDCGELTAALDKYSEEAIINMCHAWYDKGIELERKSWLEKQGQVKESTISQHENKMCKENDDSLTYDDERIRKEIINYFHCQSEEEPTRKKVHNKWIAWLGKQGEQKPADKVEPKFKVGDKIYLKPEYRMPDDDTPIANTVKEIRRIDDKHYRFDGSYIFIEDQDKYELVEPKTKENKGNIGGIFPNWSEEDKGIIEEVVSYLINYSNIVESKEDADRIEYLIDKIQDICPHQKQEWSEEDEQHIDSLLKRLDALCRNKFERTRFAISEDRNWLKSLRPHNLWKPSDEQMSLLQAIINEPNNAASESCQIVLREVLEQLKKLKEE